MNNQPEQNKEISAEEISMKDAIDFVLPCYRNLDFDLGFKTGWVSKSSTLFLPKQLEAIEFAEWVGKNEWVSGNAMGKVKWWQIGRMKNVLTTTELYKLYLQSK